MKDKKCFPEGETSQRTSESSSDDTNAQSMSITSSKMDGIFSSREAGNQAMSITSSIMDGIDSVTIAAPSSPGKMDGQTMSVNSADSSIIDCIYSAMLDSIGALSISLINDDQNGLRRCIHAGSWANVYRFDDPTNACGGKTGAV
eukprot:4820870-Ditylum_brightwellii.AAC.1